MAEMINIVNKALTAYFADHINISESDMSFQKPKKDWINSTAATTVPQMSIYLFDIRENIELRNNEWQSKNYDTAIKRKKPDVRIDLFYIITFYSRNTNIDESIKEEHKWLSETLSVVYNNTYIPKEYFYDDETGEIISDIPNIPAIPIQEKLFGEDSVLQLWSALNQYLMPAIYLKVTIPVSLAKYFEEAKVLRKILKFGISDQKYYNTLNINPPVAFLVCDDNNGCILSKIETKETLNYLDAEATVNTDEITLINRNNINSNDFIVIKEGTHSELCKVVNMEINTDNNKITLTLESELKYFHPKGSEIKKAEVGTPEELQQINFIENIQAGITQLKVMGRDVEKLKSGDLVSLKNNSGSAEYFFITAKFKENIEIKEILEVDGLNT